MNGLPIDVTSHIVIDYWKYATKPKTTTVFHSFDRCPPHVRGIVALPCGKEGQIAFF